MEQEERRKAINSWAKSAAEDLEIAEKLFGLKKFSYCLFFCQLALEKILKAIFIKTNDSYPPPTHKLQRLAKLANTSVNREKEQSLAEITTFNIEARYDIYKEKLYKIATREFTEKYLSTTHKLFVYFKQLV